MVIPRFDRFRTIAIGVIAAVMAASGSGLAADQLKPPAGHDSHVMGIDVSHHNAEIAWPDLAKTNVNYVIHKATQGVEWLDPLFVYNFGKLKEEKALVRGAYHYFSSADDGLEQAEGFIRNVTLEPGDLPPIVDVEDLRDPHGENVHDELRIFLDRLKEHYGVAPVIYTSHNLWEKISPAPFVQNPLWVAHYGVPNPELPDGWTTWNMWQFTDGVSVDGSPQPVDASIFNGTRADFETFLMPAEQASAPAAPTTSPAP